MVDGLTGQREDPDLRHLPQQLFVAAAERQDLAALRWVLHHLSGSEQPVFIPAAQSTDSHYSVTTRQPCWNMVLQRSSLTAEGAELETLRGV